MEKRPMTRSRLARRLLGAALAACWLVTAASAVEIDRALHWSALPPLPDAHGFGGPFAGVSGGALLVAGGANFPDAPPWENGAKVWHDRVFALAPGAAEWRLAGQLPRRLAYGVSVTVPEGLLLIGGESDGKAVADVRLLRWEGEQLESDAWPSLPRPASYLAGAKLGDHAYVAASTRSPTGTRLDEKHFWRFDLAQFRRTGAAAWEELPPWPGAPRHKAAAAAQSVGTDQLQFFLISGENPSYLPDGTLSPEVAEPLVDGYRYDPVARQWTRIADLPPLDDPRDLPGKEAFAAKPWPVVASTAIDAGQSHVLVFSGSTNRYAGLPVAERPEFVPHVLAYHTITDTWVRAGDMPQAVVTTVATRWNDRIVIPSGEIKPGVRTPNVQALQIRSLPPEFGWLNYGVLGVYLLGMVGVGGWFALRTKSSDDFFRGGQRVPAWVAGLSIFATMLSSITYVSLPAKAYATDWAYYPAQLTVLPIAWIAIALAIPFFRGIDATTAYEYLELRFNRSVRLIGSLLFVMFQIGRMAVVMYLPALALAAITPLGVVECIVAMGVLSVIYCTLGGVEAVVWTDAIQTLVLMGGLLLALLVIVANLDGGVADLCQTAWDDGKMRLADLDFSAGSYAMTALWVVVLGQFFQSLYSYTSDQAIVQRYLTTRDEAGARRAMWTTAWMSVFGSLLFFVLGAALYVFYKRHPIELDPAMKTDAIFPWFIATRLPAGTAGLVVAGIFAAAQSTISTSMNSTATAVVADFCMPFGVCRTDRGYLWLGRFCTFAFGVLGTYFAYLFAVTDVKSMVDQYLAILGLFGGAICGLFLLGMLTVRTSAVGGLLGGLLGTAAVWWAKDHTALNFFLYAMVGTAATFASGYAISWLFPSDPVRALPYTIYGRRAPSV